MTTTTGTDHLVTTATRFLFVGDCTRISALTQPDAGMTAIATVFDVPADLAGAVVVVPRVPDAGDFAQMTDQELDTDLGGALSELLAWVQAVVQQLADSRGHLIIVLPAEPTLGQVGAAMSGTFCGAALSMARTLAIELDREHITVNTVMHGEPTPAIRTGFAAQLQALVEGDAITGQEIYVTSGTDLGRLRP
jgi:NAD(P)-dependent dehydrogenase (short-subunit alcohol dehydrogenase family)